MAPALVNYISNKILPDWLDQIGRFRTQDVFPAYEGLSDCHSRYCLRNADFSSFPVEVCGS